MYVSLAASDQWGLFKVQLQLAHSKTFERLHIFKYNGQLKDSRLKVITLISHKDSRHTCIF